MLTRNALLARRLIFTVGSGFALTLVLIGTIAWLGLRQVEITNADLEKVVNEHGVKSRLAVQMRDILRDRAISMHSIPVITDPFERDDEMLRFYAYGSAYQKVRLELAPLVNSDQEKTVLASIDRLTRINQPLMVRTVDVAVEGYTFLAFDLLKSEAIPLQRQLVRELDAFTQIQRDKMQAAAALAKNTYTKTRNLIIFLGLLALLVAAVVALAVVRRTARLAAATEREGTKFETLFETNTDGIVILDGRGFIDCNPAALNMFHMASKSAFLACKPPELGQDPQACGTPADLLAARQIGAALEQGHASFEWTAQRQDGSTFPAHIDLHAMTLDGQKVIQAIMRDVSAQKETEDTLRAARDAALSATQMKSQFVANVSHEIRTPMNGIMGMTQLLLTSSLNPRQKEYAEAIARSAESLLSVINDLLDFSKIEAGRMHVETVDFDLSAQLRDILALYIPRADAKQLALRLERREDSRADLPDWVRGDPLRLRQILLNLLDNAIKFTQRGEVRLIVEALPEQPGMIRFSVRDTGLGMSDEVQARIFKAFAQGDGSVTRKFGGTGLGLAICRQLAELMGGSLTLESAADAGSTFHLTLPLPAADPINADILPKTEADLRLLRFPGTRVLVAEDNPVNQKLARYMLENLEIEVVLADDGRQAFDRLTQERAQGLQINLVFMDFQMPEWDGLTATRAIRVHEQENNLPRIPIIALTANAMTGFEETCRQAGMDGFLTKPLREEDLAAILLRWAPESAKRVESADLVLPAGEAEPIPSPYALDKVRQVCRNNPDQIREMLELFLHTTPPLITALRQALQSSDALQAARQAHQIKGAAAYLGADTLTGLAGKAEQAAKAGQLDICGSACNALEKAFESMTEIIEADVRTLTAGNTPNS